MLASEVYDNLPSTAPGPVSRIGLLKLNSTTSVISWEAPQTPNGLILTYNITVVSVANGSVVLRKHVGNDVLMIMATNLGKSVFCWDMVLLQYS